MNTLDNFIDSIHRSHLDNAQNLYMAEKVGQRGRLSVSPLTNFVFEFFLFNSLYSIDWFASFASSESHQLVKHPRENPNFNEAKQQRAFVKFCRDRFKSLDSSKIAEAFLPLAGLDSLSSDWTTVTPDSRITADDGIRFFEKIEQIGKLATRNDLKATKATFDLINDCCYYVYLVRNNIFHGAKSLGEIHERDQARRISVYDLFVRCLNSLFFLSVGRPDHGSSYAQLPIIQNVGTNVITLPQQAVYRFLQDRLLKPHDSLLHWKLFREGGSLPLDGDARRGMFYPTAGKDILFPLLVGLPYCTDFYFFEQHRRIPLPIREVVAELGSKASAVDSGDSDCECHEFQIGSIDRRIWTMRKDNLAFLDLDIPLAFYFHRGDNDGEGGSRQRWDSELLPHLLDRAPVDVGLRILTDGQPGGLDEGVKSKLTYVTLRDGHRRRDYCDYFYGVVQEAPKS